MPGRGDIAAREPTRPMEARPRAYETAATRKYRPRKSGFSTKLVCPGGDCGHAGVNAPACKNRKSPPPTVSGPRGTRQEPPVPGSWPVRLIVGASRAPTPEPAGFCEICPLDHARHALDVISGEIDGGPSHNRPVDNIRELIEPFPFFAPVQARWKSYVIDECHNALDRGLPTPLPPKQLEEPPPRVCFVLAHQTDPQRVCRRSSPVASASIFAASRGGPGGPPALHRRAGADRPSPRRPCKVVAQTGPGRAEGMRRACSTQLQAWLAAPIEVGRSGSARGRARRQELLNWAWLSALPFGSSLEADRGLPACCLTAAANLPRCSKGLASLFARSGVGPVSRPRMRPELKQPFPPVTGPQLLELAHRLSSDRFAALAESQLKGDKRNKQLRPEHPAAPLAGGCCWFGVAGRTSSRCQFRQPVHPSSLNRPLGSGRPSAVPDTAAPPPPSPLNPALIPPPLPVWGAQLPTSQNLA